MSSNFNISFKGSGSLLLISLFLLFSVALSAQADKKNIRKGNREYNDSKYAEAEILYRKAIDENKQSPDAIFNIGDALYKQKKYEDAGKQFIENANQNESREKKSAGLYNLGNSMLMAKKLKESIDAYKGSLKLNPDSKEAKYNLAYAQDLLKQQEEQQKQQEKDKQDQNKDDKNKDQNKDNKDKDQQKDQDKKDDKQNDQNKDQQQQQQSISKEDAQRLLNALANDEKNVQEKVKLAKAAKTRTKTVKNW
jgi:Ca-activated chloride channel family protein